MGLVSIVLLVIFVIGCVLLVLVILLQDEHGEGLGGLLAGSSASFGPRTGNVLTRFTSILAVVFLVGAFAVAWLNRTPEVGDVVRKARLEELKTGSQSDWWVQSSTTSGSSAGSGAAATSAEQGSGVSAPAEGTQTTGTPAAEKPASGQ